jgi:alkanesulfonate monooxygenase SsuD/methylene tetrahydromethanopterin reductase-like flavin-dependent oxidoreductase (luciferase family)
VAEDTKTAVAEARPFLEAKYKAYQAWKQDEALPEGETFDLSFEELARDRFIVGDPARAIDEIERYRERLGITELSFRVQWPGMPQATVLRTIRLLGEKVLPKLR